MAKSREKIQQIGFWDSEVSSPDHDAVCLWAYENSELIFHQICPRLFDRPWADHEIKLEQHINQPEWTDAAKEFAKNNPRPNPRVTQRTLEYVLKSYTGHNKQYERIVGYGDLLIEAVAPKIIGDYKYNSYSGLAEELNKYEIGWSAVRGILVEAKSQLPTVGELMRQIQLYRTAFNGHVVVVSPDDKYARVLAEQDVFLSSAISNMLSQSMPSQRRYCYPAIECKLGSNGRPDLSTP